MRRLLLTVLLLLPCMNGYQARHMMESSDSHEFGGRTLKCGVALADGLRGSLQFGLNYEILQAFGEVNGCEMSVKPVSDTVDLCADVVKGKLDIAVLSGKDTCEVKGIDKHVSPDGEFIWATARKGNRYSLLYDSFIAYAATEDEELIQMRQLFGAPYDPHRRAEAGIHSRMLSPYDNLIKIYSKDIGWNWKMLAALIYSESKFTINNVSPQGAVGLMQLMPKTGSKFSTGNLMDPEENIKAGTAYIGAIQRKYFNDGDISQENKEKLVLASFNAGTGRIAQCRRIAGEMGMDPNSWEDVSACFQYCSGFSGAETVAYVDQVLSVYRDFCTICRR